MIVADSIEIKRYTEGGTAAALGSFDALHRGHTEIIKKAVEDAKRRGVRSLVQFFRVPPGGFSEDGKLECVNTPERRLEILEELGVDLVAEEHFTDGFKNTDYKSFIDEYICGRYNAKSVFAGYNYRFGHFANGNADILRTECAARGIDVYIQPCVSLGGEVSSSELRRLIKRGETERAAELMGRCYEVCGTVVHGRHIGRTYGFPTANINMPSGLVIPMPGVYKTRTVIGGKEYTAITNVGSKPTFAVEEKNIETHIIGFDGDLYGKNIRVEFLRLLRGICAFKNSDELKKQLETDTRAALEK